MTLEEILKSQGLSDEQIATITSEMKQNKIFTTAEENLDIRYGKLKGEFDNLTEQHGEATKLIDQLKSGTKDSEKLQGLITTHEQTIESLQNQLKEANLASEIKVALLAAGVEDVEYMTFKLKEKGELELGEDGHIKGIDDKIAGLKTQFPNQFAAAQTEKHIEVTKLPSQNNTEKTVTPEEFAKMGYDSRVKLKEQNPELYKTLKG